MFFVVCANKRFNPMSQSFQLNLWPDFLAGRVPRRKNFAESFEKYEFQPVKQGVFDKATYSQNGSRRRIPVEILSCCANCF
jgi:hypothetical protein